MTIRSGWIPPRSPYSLIQEDVWPNEWMILVVCIMLNQTQRKQVEKVLPRFVKLWPSPQKFLQAAIHDVVDVIRPLGFYNRRSVCLTKMTHAYVNTSWTHAKELPGIGEYGSRSWEIFCQGKFGNDPPKDHALVQYHKWVTLLRLSNVTI